MLFIDRWRRLRLRVLFLLCLQNAHLFDLVASSELSAESYRLERQGGSSTKTKHVLGMWNTFHIWSTLKYKPGKVFNFCSWQATEPQQSSSCCRRLFQCQAFCMKKSCIVTLEEMESCVVLLVWLIMYSVRYCDFVILKNTEGFSFIGCAIHIPT